MVKLRLLSLVTVVGTVNVPSLLICAWTELTKQILYMPEQMRLNRLKKRFITRLRIRGTNPHSTSFFQKILIVRFMNYFELQHPKETC